MTAGTGAERYTARIAELAHREQIPSLIERYLDPTEPYAAFSFDTAGSNPPLELTTDDLLALNFLDVPIRPISYRRLVELQPEVNGLLRKLSPDLHLWQMTRQTQAYEDADSLWRLLTGVAGIGPTRASKIMARKRPKLIPILDRWTRDFYGDTDRFWVRLAEALRSLELRRAIEAMRPPGLDTSALSLLRILDIAIWMSAGRRPPSVHPDDEL